MPLTIDTTAPTLTLVGVAENGTLFANSRLVGHASGTGSVITSLTYRFGTLPEVPVSVAADGTFDAVINFTGVSNGLQTLTLTTVDQAGNVKTQPLDVTVNLNVSVPTTFMIALANDTGNSTDGITTDPTIAGTFVRAENSSPLQVWASFDGLTFTNITNLVGTGTQFSLNRTALEMIYKGTLVDGFYTLRLQVRDEAGTVLSAALTAFTCDTTAPELNLTGLIDGITWNEGQRLVGRVSDADTGTQLTYQIDQGNGATLTGLSPFDVLLALPQMPESGATSHTLTVTGRDRAGNQSQQRYRFLRRDTRPPVDDETDTRPTPPDPNGTGGPLTEPMTGLPGKNSWGDHGGGSGFNWGWLTGGGPGGGPGSDNNGDGGFGDGGGGSYWGVGYGGEDSVISYSERIRIILEKADELMPTGSRRAALRSRRAVLLAAASEIEQGGFYTRMSHSLYGIYAIASTIRYANQAENVGVYLASQAMDSNDPAIKVQVMEATLLATVNAAFKDLGYTSTGVEYDQLVQAIRQIATIYAKLEPNADAQPIASTAPDFLDAVWRRNLAAGETALESLLDKISNANEIRALTFISGLLQAAMHVESLKEDMKDARFIKELVEFGFEFAKLNPNATPGAGGETLKEFLATLWSGNADNQQIQSVQGGLSWLFEGLTTRSERIEMLDYQQKLMRSLKLMPDNELQLLLQDASFASMMIDWGAKYIASLDDSNWLVHDLEGFFSAVASSQYDQGILVASTNLSQLISSSSNNWLNWLKNTPGTRDDFIRYTHLASLEEITQGPWQFRDRTKYYLKAILKEWVML